MLPGLHRPEYCTVLPALWRDPTGLDKRSADTYYTEQIDGKESIRVIFNPAITHPWAHFSKNVVADSVTFFDKALDAPIKLDANNQTWQWKAFFNTVGIAGFFMFVIYAAIALLDARYFAELKPAADAQPPPAPKGKGKGWYWGGLAFGAIMGVILYPTIYAWCSKNRPAFWNQEATWYIGMWTFLCGVFTILFMVVAYNCYSKKNGLDLAERGVKISGRKLWKTIVLSLIVVVAAYALVFISDYLFLTDFRLWCFITIRAFAPMHLPPLQSIWCSGWCTTLPCLLPPTASTLYSWVSPIGSALWCRCSSSLSDPRS